MTTPTPRSLAQQLVREYISQVDPYTSHAENVRLFLQEPVLQLTTDIFKDSNNKSATTSPGNKENHGRDTFIFAPDEAEFSKINDKKCKINKSKVEPSLPPRAQARLEAFLLGVTLALPKEDCVDPVVPSSPQRSPALPTKSSNFSGPSTTLLFRPTVVRQVSSSSSSSSLMRTLSVSSMSGSWNRRPQISESDLTTRMELYVRVVQRAKALSQDCTIAVESLRAIKARARGLVTAFVESVSTVQQQSPVLTRLLVTLTREVLSVSVLSENLHKLIRRMVSDYEHKTSFASLAFLSSPEHAAGENLTPMVVKYLCHLRSNWRALEAACELELLLQESLDPDMRHTFKTVEFCSMDHLLDVCQNFRSELQHVEVPPTMVLPTSTKVEDDYSCGGLQHETISVNGHLLPSIHSSAELEQWLSKTLSAPRLLRGGKHGRRRSRFVPGAAGRVLLPLMASEFSSASEVSDSESSILSSGTDSTTSMTDKKSSVRQLAKHLMKAASGSFAHAVAHDLFGGEDVQVVSAVAATPLSSSRGRETMEVISSRGSGSVTIRRHGSFEVYPKAFPGCNPLIQVHTTTQETIALLFPQQQGGNENAGQQGSGGLKMRIIVQP